MNVIIDIIIYLKEKGTTNNRRFQIDLNEKELTIGREDTNELQIIHTSISRKQATIQLINDKMMYTDLSRNGSVIISKISGPKELKNQSNLYVNSGDMIILPGDDKFQAMLFIR